VEGTCRVSLVSRYFGSREDWVLHTNAVHQRVGRRLSF
jgi:hypothetical protein